MQLRHMTKAVFVEMKALRLVDISHNPLNYLDKDSFQFGSKIQSLNLTDVDLIDVHPDSFVPLIYLQQLTTS